MEKCVLCDKPLPARSKPLKTSKDLVCSACNQNIMKEPQKDDTDEMSNRTKEEAITLKEIKKRIKHLEKMANELRDMIETSPDYCGESEEMAEKLPKALQPYVYTPLKSYKMTELLLAIAKGEYMDIITKQESGVRLEKALKTSI